jgi:hypothetical protein
MLHPKTQNHILHLAYFFPLLYLAFLLNACGKTATNATLVLANEINPAVFCDIPTSPSQLNLAETHGSLGINWGCIVSPNSQLIYKTVFVAVETQRLPGFTNLFPVGVCSAVPIRPKTLLLSAHCVVEHMNKPDGVFITRADLIDIHGMRVVWGSGSFLSPTEFVEHEGSIYRAFNNCVTDSNCLTIQSISIPKDYAVDATLNGGSVVLDPNSSLYRWHDLAIAQLSVSLPAEFQNALPVIPTSYDHAKVLSSMGYGNTENPAQTPFSTGLLRYNQEDLYQNPVYALFGMVVAWGQNGSVRSTINAGDSGGPQYVFDTLNAQHSTLVGIHSLASVSDTSGSGISMDLTTSFAQSWLGGQYKSTNYSLCKDNADMENCPNL